MKIIVCGDKHWKDTLMVTAVLTKYKPAKPVIIHGNERGLDRIAARVAERLGLDILRHEADHYHEGSKAPYLRNREMLEMEPELVIAFHDFISNSRDTKHMVSTAKKLEIPVKLFSHKRGSKDKP